MTESVMNDFYIWLLGFFNPSTESGKANRNYDRLLQLPGLKNILKSLQEMISDQLLMQLLPPPTPFDS